jgi:predicted O-methyltransferase YrrM
MHDGPARQRLSGVAPGSAHERLGLGWRAGGSAKRRSTAAPFSAGMLRTPDFMDELKMTSTLQNPRVRSVLDSMHAASERIDPPLLAKAKGKTQEERDALLGDAFIPVDANAGRLLYTLARGCAPGTFVEFGTSFGISTIYLAAAVRDRGVGRVITTELHAGKAARARDYIQEAGLLDVVDLRVGDALETLKDLPQDVALVFLDGWKNLYLPCLKLLEPKLKPGALVIADDIDLFPDPLRSYLDYVRAASGGYVSVKVPIGDAMELSTRVI